jgi:hypothetical protein
VIHSGSNQIRGGVIARSFADNVLPDPVFMSAFVSCVTYDDYFVRPECYGYRIFLGPEVSVRCFPHFSSLHFSFLSILVLPIVSNMFFTCRRFLMSSVLEGSLLFGNTVTLLLLQPFECAYPLQT